METERKEKMATFRDELRKITEIQIANGKISREQVEANSHNVESLIRSCANLKGKFPSLDRSPIGRNSLNQFLKFLACLEFAILCEACYSKENEIDFRRLVMDGLDTAEAHCLKRISN